MRALPALSVALVAAGSVVAFYKFAPPPRKVPRVDAQGALLANGWRLTPAGRQVPLPGDMPGTLLLSPDGGTLYVNTCGYHGHSLNAIDTRTGRVVRTYALGVDWVGMAMDPRQGELLISAGGAAPFKAKPHDAGADALDFPAEDRAAILRFQADGGNLAPRPGVAVPGLEAAQQYVGGMVARRDGSLAVVNVQNDSVYLLSAGPERRLLAQAKVEYRPYGVAESPDGKTLAVSNWGARSVTLLDGRDLSVLKTVPVGIHPTALRYGPDGRLYVACASSNAVYVLRGGEVVERVRTSLDPRDPLGSAPLALALSPDGGTLYVANADNNDVAVVDVRDPHESRVAGFIPTGRYPSALAVSPDGRRLYVGVAKGLRNAPNYPPRPEDVPRGRSNEAPHTYIADMLQGVVSIVDVPNRAQLAAYTRQSLDDRPKGRIPSGVEPGVLDALRKNVHHILYVIRENRTYDQVMGDVPGGNGDPNIVMFGQKVTPNAHRLVHDFTLLDNLYCDGEVSQVGHQWTDSAYATDFNEKTWVLGYSDRQEIKADPRLNSSPAGYLWDDALRHGRTARIYGEYVKWQEDHGPAEGEVKKDPEKFGCSAAFEKVFARRGRDTEKVDVFLDEMHAAEKTGKWWNFMVMALPEDHTSGLTPGKHTPEACVGNNDLAIGRLIDGISHSRFWKDTAVFVIQDDAQDGPDHVDAHRTVGLVVSPYVRRNAFDSTMYSTSSMIRTMELILGLPPMTQYDKAATPMLPLFTAKPDFAPFSALPPGVDVDAMNPPSGPLAERSKRLDFSDIDRADPHEFNAILWEWTKPGVPMPAPVHGLR